jgi:hypothetical protein
MGFATTGKLQKLRDPVDNAQDVVELRETHRQTHFGTPTYPGI